MLIGHPGVSLEFRKLNPTHIRQLLEFADFLGQPLAILAGKPTRHPGGVAAFLVCHKFLKPLGDLFFKATIDEQILKRRISRGVDCPVTRLTPLGLQFLLFLFAQLLRCIRTKRLAKALKSELCSPPRTQPGTA